MPPIEPRPAGLDRNFRSGPFFYGQGIRTMNRNVMMLVIGGLAVAVVVLGYQVYQDRQKKGVEISIGEKGISIEKK
jgi:hypothetical protein